MTNFYYEISTSIISGSIAIAGLCIQQVLKYKNERTIEQYGLLKKRLENFYYPVYFLLKQDTYLHKLINSFSDDQLKVAVVSEIDKMHLKNHKAILHVIEMNISTANPRSDVMRAITQYIEHVTAYRNLRKLNIESTPAQFKLNYPTEFESIMNTRICELRKEISGYDKIQGSNECGNFDHEFINQQKVSCISFN
jgi:hypothetical protein